MKHILSISGSIRTQSSSHAVIEEFASLLPVDITFERYEDLATIPAFDGSEIDPLPVKLFKERIQKADGILICTPEYAFGVPGALKNAIDWTVGTGEFVNKSVALITASSQGKLGHEAMQLILNAVSAKLSPETTLLISAVRSKVKNGKVIDLSTRQQLQDVVQNFKSIINSPLA